MPLSSFSRSIPMSIVPVLPPSVRLWTVPGRLLRAAGGLHLHPGLPAAVRDPLLQLPGLHRGGGGVRPGQDLPPSLLRLCLMQVRNRVVGRRTELEYKPIRPPVCSKMHKTQFTGKKALKALTTCRAVHTPDVHSYRMQVNFWQWLCLVKSKALQIVAESFEPAFKGNSGKVILLSGSLLQSFFGLCQTNWISGSSRGF